MVQINQFSETKPESFKTNVNKEYIFREITERNKGVLQSKNV